MQQQLSLLHRRIRMAKAKDCTEAQDSREPRWSDAAYAKLVEFAKQREGDWLCEEYRYWAVTNGLQKPENAKAFGTVITRALKAGVIRQAGFSKNTRNASIKATYRLETR
jgi:hypothetical protein